MKSKKFKVYDYDLWGNKKDGFEVKKGKWSKVAVICENANVGDIKAFLENGDCYIQDEAAMLAVELLEPKAGEIIFDLCAAPGGKATYIAEIMNNTSSTKRYSFPLNVFARLSVSF